VTAQPLVRLLGAITVREPTGGRVAPPRMDRVVLAHLALAEGRAVPTDDLVEALWGPVPPAGARNALQVKVSRLRRLVGADALRHDQGSYRLILPADEVDLLRLRRRRAAAQDALAAGRHREAAETARNALDLWQGPPLAGLDEHPRLVAARMAAVEDRAALLELEAEAALADGSSGGRSVALLRELLAEDPLRPRARLLLMRALDRTGRRAEALAVYDVGRRVLAEQTGLAPPSELRREFERLLAAERVEVRREEQRPAVRTIPSGALETAWWLAREGARPAAVELALRGAWWWWLGGRRSEGRDLLAELVVPLGEEHAGDTTGLIAWTAVFDAVTADAERALVTGEEALRSAWELGWGRHAAVAAVLLAERLLQRGEPRRGALLLEGARVSFARDDDHWGTALTGLVTARAALQRGAVARAAAGARRARQRFAELDDAAGQMMAMDLLGYCAEVVGDLTAAERTHRRALGFARAVDAPEWQATQLTRLGSVQALLGANQAAATLRDAAHLARSIGSAAGAALADNGRGLAAGLLGDHDRALAIHTDALAWYDRQGSRAGVSYTAGRLALELVAAGERAEAVRLAVRSVDLAGRTGDPRAIAHGLEAVALTHDDAPTRARAIGGARALRRRTGSPLPAVLAGSVTAAEAALADELGADLAPLLRAGAREASDLAGLGAAS